MKAQLGGRRNNKYKGTGLGSLDAAQAGSSEALAAAKHAGEREEKNSQQRWRQCARAACTQPPRFGEDSASGVSNQRSVSRRSPGCNLRSDAHHPPNSTETPKSVARACLAVKQTAKEAGLLFSD